MTEYHLHQLWKQKRFPFHRLKTTCNQSIDILDFGTYNTASGPDFFNGTVRIGDLTFCGNIELHLKSSDWYVHKHHLDPAYDNVVLHVVLKHDKPVLINGVEVITLELGNEVGWLGDRLPEFRKHTIACGGLLFGTVEFESHLETIFRNRLNRKAKRFSEGHSLQRFFESVVESFGKKVNNEGFLALAQSIRIELLLRATPLQKKAMILGVSGYGSEEDSTDWKSEWEFLKRCHGLNELNHIIWKKSGNRPSSFPDKKMQQLLGIINHIDWQFPFWEQSVTGIRQYWKETLNAGKLSSAFTDHLLINVVAPYLWFLAELYGRRELHEKAVELLRRTPAEDNTIIRNMSKFEFRPEHALHTQALLELCNEWCDKKQCLQCSVGINMLIY